MRRQKIKYHVYVCFKPYSCNVTAKNRHMAKLIAYTRAIKMAFKLIDRKNTNITDKACNHLRFIEKKAVTKENQRNTNRTK
jgi:hypothetical protein